MIFAKNKAPLLLLNTLLVFQLYSQNERVYNHYIKENNFTLKDLQDTVVRIEYLYKDRMQKDYKKQNWIFKLNNLTNNQYPDIEFASKYTLVHLKNGNITVSSRKFMDTLWFRNKSSNVKKMNFPEQFGFVLLNHFPTWQSSWYSKRGFKKPKFYLKISDTTVFIQHNSKDSISRLIYFDSNGRPCKIDVYFKSTGHLISHEQYNISYHKTYEFNYLMQIDKLYKYTIPDETEKVVKNTMNTETLRNGNLFKKEYYLLEYWYIGCLPCRKMMPNINDFYLRSDTAKMGIIGINCIDKQSAIDYYSEISGIHYSQLNCSEIKPIYQMNEYPAILLLDSNFNTIRKWVGYSPEIVLEIEKQLLFLKLIRKI